MLQEYVKPPRSPGNAPRWDYVPMFAAICSLLCGIGIGISDHLLGRRHPQLLGSYIGPYITGFAGALAGFFPGLLLGFLLAFTARGASRSVCWRTPRLFALFGISTLIGLLVSGLYYLSELGTARINYDNIIASLQSMSGHDDSRAYQSSQFKEATQCIALLSPLSFLLPALISTALFAFPMTFPRGNCKSP